MPRGETEWLRENKEGQVLGYGDSGRHGTTRHGNMDGDDEISLEITGRPPQNEEDTARVCELLATVKSSDGVRFRAVEQSDRDVDGELHSDTDEVQEIQVVRAWSESDLWRTLSIESHAQRSLTISEAIELLRVAIDNKRNRLPVAQRRKLILALDAGRLPGLALEPVVAALLAGDRSGILSAEFAEIWLVGPNERLTWRLDG